MFTAQFAEITQKKRLLMSGGLGTMGYGLPGAIGAKIGNPDVPVISISGDASAVKAAVLEGRQTGLELLIGMGTYPEIPGTPYL